MLRARGRAFQAGLSRRALGATFATWQEARVAASRVREHRMARACVALWRSHVHGVWADGQLRRARARQAFTAWRVAQDQRREARQQAEDRARAQTQLALCWALWVQESRLHQLSRAHAARKLSARWMPRAFLDAGPGVGWRAGERVFGGWCQGLGGWGCQGKAILVIAAGPRSEPSPSLPGCVTLLGQVSL